MAIKNMLEIRCQANGLVTRHIYSLARLWKNNKRFKFKKKKKREKILVEHKNKKDLLVGIDNK